MIKAFFLALGVTVATIALIFCELCTWIMFWEWLCAKCFGVDFGQPSVAQAKKTA